MRLKRRKKAPLVWEEGELLSSDNELPIIKEEHVIPPPDDDAQRTNELTTIINSEPVEQHEQSQKSNESVILSSMNVNVNVSNFQVLNDTQPGNTNGANSESVTNTPKATVTIADYNVSPVTESSINLASEEKKTR